MIIGCTGLVITVPVFDAPLYIMQEGYVIKTVFAGNPIIKSDKFINTGVALGKEQVETYDFAMVVSDKIFRNMRHVGADILKKSPGKRFELHLGVIKVVTV